MSALLGVSPWQRVVRKVRTEVARRTLEVPREWPAGRRAVSFTFDDFPVTAATAGASVLESFGIQGTFYASFGMAGKDSPGGLICTPEQMAALAARGHEIGCHTFSHLDCSVAAPNAVRSDCEHNRDAAARLGVNPLTSFAYPFGGLNRAARRVTAAAYGCARTMFVGTNRGTFDLAALRAVPVTTTSGLDAVRRHLEEMEAKGGWVVLATHDVSPYPSRYGCTPELLADVCRLAVGSGAELLPTGSIAAHMNRS